MKKLSIEEKELLLKELSARLPWGIKCSDSRHGDSRITEIDIVSETIYCDDFDEDVKIENVKPYLRPISSMTEEEKKEYHELCDNYYDIYFDTVASIDWLNKKMFDCRKDDEGKTMIKKGLALEAPRNMYK